MVVFLHRRASWPQTSIEKVLFDVEYSRVLVFQGGVIECSSRMTGNCQVRFLEGWPPAMGAGYSAEHMQTLVSVVNSRERKMLGALLQWERRLVDPSSWAHDTAGVKGAPKLS
jgi:hypothetical protein